MISTQKHPDSTEDFVLDWRKLITDADGNVDTIVSPVAWTATGANIVGTPTTDGMTTTIRLSGGTAGHSAVVEGIATLTSGQLKTATIRIAIIKD